MQQSLVLMRPAYLDVCLGWQIDVLVEVLAELLGLTSRVVAKRLGVAPGRRATAHVARRAAAHRTGGSAHIARWGGPWGLGAWVGSGHMRAADLRGAARVRSRATARVVGTLRAGVGGAIIRWDLEVATRITRHLVWSDGCL